MIQYRPKRGQCTNLGGNRPHIWGKSGPYPATLAGRRLRPRPRLRASSPPLEAALADVYVRTRIKYRRPAVRERTRATGWHGLPSSRLARAEGSDDEIVICDFDETLDGLDDDFDDDDFDSSSRPEG